MTEATSWAMSGSSPRAWGAPGNGSGTPHPLAVHPHVRGERGTGGGAAGGVSGSSPRAWGAHGVGPEVEAQRRFIPTCVGSAPRAWPCGRPPSVHPHVRGERATMRQARAAGSGSSPRAWGAPELPRGRWEAPRFIPTCVGSAPPPYMSTRGWLGSSPRAWGARPCRSSLRASSRFIPTCVGSALRGRAGRPMPSVHPHVRGERVEVDAEPGPELRFIPTCVGSARVLAAGRWTTPVHPHVRGERVGLVMGYPRPFGSSPRAWGAHLEITRHSPLLVRHVLWWRPAPPQGDEGAKDHRTRSVRASAHRGS